VTGSSPSYPLVSGSEPRACLSLRLVDSFLRQCRSLSGAVLTDSSCVPCSVFFPLPFRPTVKFRDKRARPPPPTLPWFTVRFPCFFPCLGSTQNERTFNDLHSIRPFTDFCGIRSTRLLKARFSSADWAFYYLDYFRSIRFFRKAFRDFLMLLRIPFFSDET